MELDELNRLFTSKNVEDVIKFYDHFDTAEQLIEWMKNRPSAPMKIYEVEGEKDIVVVIPTANHEGELAKNCANNIFKGQQIVFVESNGPFFNYARSCNYGLKYALKYNPKWIVLSNDDVIKIDEISKLKLELSNVDGNTDVVFINQSKYHSFQTFIAHRNILLILMRAITSKPFKNYNKLLDKFSIKYDTVSKFRLSHGKFALYTKIHSFLNIGDFGIFSTDFVSSHKPLFDEVFINDYEDLYLSLLIDLEKEIKKTQISFSIGDIIGGTIGRNRLRTARDLVSLSYFNKQIIKIYGKVLNLK